MRTQHGRAAVGPRLLVVALALAAVGCASAGRSVAQSESRGVDVIVDNQNFHDAVIYAIWDSGPRTRLGMVTGITTQTFTTATRGSGQMRVQIDLIAGSNVITESIGVFHGDEIHVVIPPNV